MDTGHVGAGWRRYLFTLVWGGLGALVVWILLTIVSTAWQDHLLLRQLVQIENTRAVRQVPAPIQTPAPITPPPAEAPK